MNIFKCYCKLLYIIYSCEALITANTNIYSKFVNAKCYLMLCFYRYIHTQYIIVYEYIHIRFNGIYFINIFKYHYKLLQVVILNIFMCSPDNCTYKYIQFINA